MQKWKHPSFAFTVGWLHYIPCEFCFWHYCYGRWHQAATGSMGRPLMKCQQTRKKRIAQVRRDRVSSIASILYHKMQKAPGNGCIFAIAGAICTSFDGWLCVLAYRSVVCAAATNFHPTKLKPSKCTQSISRVLKTEWTHLVAISTISNRPTRWTRRKHFVSIFPICNYTLRCVAERMSGW